GGQLMDYGVHTWDIRQGSGRAHALPADTADLLVPFMFIIWQSTVRPDADLSPFTIGIRVTGRAGGASWRAPARCARPTQLAITRRHLDGRQRRGQQYQEGEYAARGRHP